jgi:hypothetical protein
MRAASNDNIEESAVESPAEMFIKAAPTGSNKGTFSKMLSGVASKAQGLKRKMKGKGKKSKTSAIAVDDGESAEQGIRPRSGAGSATVGAGTGAGAADVAVVADGASNSEGATSGEAPAVNKPAVLEAEKNTKVDPVTTAAAAKKLAQLKATLAAVTKTTEEEKAAAGVAVVPVAVNLRVAPAVSNRSKGGIGKGKRLGSRKGLMAFEETSFDI